MISDVTHNDRRRVLRLGLGILAASALLPLRAQGTASLRVITLFQGATDALVALGITPCAVVDSWSEKPTYRYLRTALNGVPHVGLETQPSLEDIVLLRPDVIIASRFRHQAIAPLLKQIAPLVMLDNVYEFKQTVEAVGRAVNRQQIAAALLLRWQQRVNRLRQLLEQHYAARWPLTVSVLDIRADHLRSYLPQSFPGMILSELGFHWNEAARQATGVSIKLSGRESLPVVNADLFFVMLHAEKSVVRDNYRALVSHPLWKQMQAPQHHQVWQVDSVTWVLSGGIIAANAVLEDIERLLIVGQPT
ncbi:iron-siderophore ABC transporter substrate-binding protein [Erwinia sp. JH02]|uniref:ABC transporter substrate-binding protein n=1 Tax=Erwinia sp. JH02 TaxID=2733394 RepID=UPI00148980C1|nr:iron-siderophore ABC transporter substrate-binding protein [Erwinia sp. JH02]NNS05621.1 iron-siderophore ABC transporter substrate-binding protein [Erwinia sp. JH02]